MFGKIFAELLKNLLANIDWQELIKLLLGPLFGTEEQARATGEAIRLAMKAGDGDDPGGE